MTTKTRYTDSERAAIVAKLDAYERTVLDPAEKEQPFWDALEVTGIWWNGQAQPSPTRYRIKLNSMRDAYTVAHLVSEHGGTYSIRDGMANGPVLTFGFRGK